MRPTRYDLSTGQAARLTNLSVQTIKKCIDSGRLKGYRLPGSTYRRIPHREVVRFANEHGIPLRRDGESNAS